MKLTCSHKHTLFFVLLTKQPNKVFVHEILFTEQKEAFISGRIAASFHNRHRVACMVHICITRDHSLLDTVCLIQIYVYVSLFASVYKCFPFWEWNSSTNDGCLDNNKCVDIAIPVSFCKILISRGVGSILNITNVVFLVSVSRNVICIHLRVIVLTAYHRNDELNQCHKHFKFYRCSV